MADYLVVGFTVILMLGAIWLVMLVATQLVLKGWHRSVARLRLRSALRRLRNSIWFELKMVQWRFERRFKALTSRR
jgi:hypothetical protein